VQDVWQDQQFTAVFVTHDVAEAVALADRILILDRGRVVSQFVVNLPRPRDRGAPANAKIQHDILELLFKKG
jgi:sulfonate transport system ATP-binding protein